ncbi:MAG: permease [Acinetobacter populi]|uniref:AEC family transporter n=1 Tax=Acinetobacter populi TaxID=1582270 RepID=UPI0023579A78|nr:permease [Acinetobacter populi]MCH4246931.1 permease [Acinetobacter populi]
MSLMLPTVSFMVGLACADQSPQLKQIFARLLSQLFIPIVIIYNMVFYQAGSIYLMLFSLFSSIMLYVVYRLFSQNKIQALCVSYPNLAWLGFPVALAIFGESVSASMVALYIGGSLFGNVIAVAALSPKLNSWQFFLKRVFLSPPVMALIIAAVLRLLGAHHLTTHVLIDGIYELTKWLMTFSGMFVLGMWLRHVKLQWSDLLQSLQLSVFRIALGSVLCVLIWLFLPKMQQQIGMMLLLFFLPPAANIVSLETFYSGTGKSAQYIASGTMISCILLLGFYLAVHFIFNP